MASKLQPVSDWRPSYMREQAERDAAIWTCQCGARSYRRLDGSFYHSGSCPVIEAQLREKSD